MNKLQLVFSIALVLIIGCAPDKATISGTITYQGKPITLGQVTFVGEDGNAVDTTLAEDGSYSISPARVGKMRVVVTAASAIPSKYTRSDATDLFAEIQPGPNTFSIDLR
ncbi:MAG: hypothetical protein C0467_20675 [Planctomycetaceae bacterium]|nr:hypothetical protein [Planctomycetaceae bacterium]